MNADELYLKYEKFCTSFEKCEDCPVFSVAGGYAGNCVIMSILDSSPNTAAQLEAMNDWSNKGEKK